MNSNKKPRKTPSLYDNLPSDMQLLIRAQVLVYGAQFEWQGIEYKNESVISIQVPISTRNPDGRMQFLIPRPVVG